MNEYRFPSFIIPLPTYKVKLQTSIRVASRLDDISHVVRTLHNFNNGQRPDDDTLNKIINLEIPGQTTILQDIEGLPENEFKDQLMELLNISPDVEPKGGKKRRSKLKSKKNRTRSRLRKSRKTRKTKTRSRRRYRK
jgi:hypothetical protein